jgi:hypothetical protein
MKTLRNLAIVLAVSCASLFSADQALLRLLPADAAFVAGIHADQIRNSRFGQFLLDQMKSEEGNLEKFVAATGFDPRRDLTELVVASDDVQKKAKKGLVVARGRFDASRIQSFATSEGAQTTTYNGVTVFTGGGKSGWLAVLDGTTAVAGDADGVRGAIDHYRAGGPGNLSPAVLDRISALSGQYDAWMVSSSLARLAHEIKDPQLGNAMGGNLMQSMESVSGGVRFGTNVEVMAEAVMRSEKDATAMVDVVKFLGGMLQLNSSQQANRDPRAIELLSLLDKMDLKATGTQFRMTLQVPEATIEQLVKPASRRKASPVI